MLVRQGYDQSTVRVVFPEWVGGNPSDEASVPLPQPLPVPVRVARGIGSALITSDGSVILPDLLTDNTEWRDRALCSQTDGEIFFPGKGDSTLPAKRICRRCEVSDECLQYALDNGESDGVWGGLSGWQRRKLKKRRAS